MTSVRAPVRLDRRGREIGRLRPLDMPMTLSMDGLSSSTMTLPADGVPLNVGNWARLYNVQGDAGVYVVRSITTDPVERTRTVELEHGMGTLSDAVVYGKVTPQSISGLPEDEAPEKVPIRRMIEALLDHQKERLWVLDACECSDNTDAAFENANVYQAIASMLPDGYMWRYDMSSLPWRLSMVAVPDAATCEMRLNRNITGMTVEVDRKNMATRIYAIGKDGLTLDGAPYVERNVDVYGLAERVMTSGDIDDAARLKEWAELQLDMLAEPKITAEVDGLELSRATGEPLDALTIGKLCRIPLPQYGTTVVERIVSLSFADAIGQPETVTIALANKHETATGAINMLLSQGSSMQSILKMEQWRIEELETAHAKLELTADQIESIVELYNFDSTGDMLDAFWTRIRESATQVEMNAVRTGLNEQGQRILAAESLINLEAGRIDLITQRGGANAYIDLYGDGVTISGGTITLDGQVIIRAIQAEIEDLISDTIQGETLIVGSIIGATCDFDDYQGATWNGTNMAPCTLTIGGKTCTFFAPEDATFELSDLPGYEDAMEAARNSVSIPDENIVLDGTASEAEGHVLRVPIEATASNGRTGNNIIEIPLANYYKGAYTSLWNAAGAIDVYDSYQEGNRFCVVAKLYPPEGYDVPVKQAVRWFRLEM